MMRTLLAGAMFAMLAGAPAFAQHAGDAFIEAFDTDHDGKLTKAEHDAARAARFVATDTDRNGSISESEYVAEFQPRLEQMVARHTEEDKKQEERQRQLRQTHIRFGVIDADKDGKISRAEYDRVAARAFAEQDADKDGVVTAADVAATAAAAAKRRADRDNS